jgi:Spy/CpxP family protein refolding chaperone
MATTISPEVTHMMTERRGIAKIVAMVCIAVVTACAGVAQAGGGGKGGEHCGKHQRHDFEKFGKKLGLSDAQKAQAKTIFQGNKAVVKPLYTALRAEQQNLRTLMHADPVDEAAIRAETAKIAGIQADLNVNRAKIGAQFRAILTPAQLTSLKTMQQKRLKKEDAATPAE